MNFGARIRRAVVRVLAWFVVVAIALVVVGALAVWIFFPKERLKRLAIEQLRDAFGVSVEIENLEFHVLRGLTLVHVTLGPPPGFRQPVLVIDRLVVSYSLAELLGDRLVVHEVLLDHPMVAFEQGPTGSNLEALTKALENNKGEITKPLDAEAAPRSKLVLDLQMLKIRGASVRIQTPNLQADLRDLDLDLSGVFGHNRISQFTTSVRLAAPHDPNLFLTARSIPMSAAVGIDLDGALDAFNQISLKATFDAGKLSVGASKDHRGRLEVALKAGSGFERIDIVALTAHLDDIPVIKATGEIGGLLPAIEAKLEIAQFVLLDPAWADLVSGLLGDVNLSGRARLEPVVVEVGLMKAPRVAGRLVVEAGRLQYHGISVEDSAATVQVAFVPGSEGFKLTMQGAVSAAVLRAYDSIATNVQATLAGEALLFGDTDLVGKTSLDIDGRAASFATPHGGGEQVQIAGHLNSAGVKGKAGELTIVDPEVTVEGHALRVRASDRRLTADRTVIASTLRGRTARFEALAPTLTGLNGTVGLEINNLKLAEQSASLVRLNAEWRNSSIASNGDFSQTIPLRMRLVAEELKLPWAEGVNTPLAITLLGDARPSSSELLITRFDIGMEDVLSVGARGRINWRTLDSDISLKKGSLALSALLRVMPPSARGAVSSLVGTLELSGHFLGRLPRGLPTFDAFPYRAELEIRPVGVGMAGSFVSVNDLSGRLRLALGGKDPSRAAVEMRLQAGSVITAVGVGSTVALSFDAARNGSDMSLDGRVTVATIDPGSFFTGPMEGVELTVGSEVTGMKRLRLKLFQAKIDSLGLRVGVEGQAAWPVGEPRLKGLTAQSNVTAQFSSTVPVKVRHDLFVDGQAEVSCSVDSLADGIVMAQGTLSFGGLNITAPKLSLTGLKGIVPISQAVALTPRLKFLFNALGLNEEAAEPDRRSRAYEETVLPLTTGDRWLTLTHVRFSDLALSDLSGNLDVFGGRVSLGNLRARFLTGDILADASVVFAPFGARRLHLAAEASQIDIAGLGALSTQGSSTVSGNVRLDIDLTERKVNAEANLTQIGRSTLKSLLSAIDPAQTNSGVVELRSFLDRYEVSPSRVSLTSRHGQVTMEAVLEMGLMARFAARFVEGFEGDTYRLPPLPVGGILGKYLGM